MLAAVRNRRALVTSVEPFDAGVDGRLHLVSLEYADADGVPEDRLIWEREPGAWLLEATALPEPSRDPPMPARDFDALVRGARWTALSPFLDPDGSAGPLTRLPIASPFHGAFQVEDFQLVPLLRALRMPRVSLLLADDVGLGKTIEAGLILSELILRRRARRILIAAPASLRLQWKQEMKEKFALSFDIVDREETHALRKRLGPDANPWRTYQRIITSYYYLKQPDVMELFRAACRTGEGSAHLPWDLLILDEAHNLTPAVYGEDSDLSRMLAQIAPYFEHRLFLTATPHNGYTRAFTGLLERLDPVRFTQRGDITPADRQRIEQVVIRRLKREINERTNPPRFCNRRPEAIPLGLGPDEVALSQAFQDFRARVRSLIASAPRGEQLAGSFAVEVLGKRLLSCPVAFADSWHRYRSGMEGDDEADATEVRAAQRAVEEETGDDRETEERTHHAARTVGAWLRPLASGLEREVAAIDRALHALDLVGRQVPPADRTARYDARLSALQTWIDVNLRLSKDRWQQDERLVVFTEYKTTLDYLEARLRGAYPEEGRIRVLFGGMHDEEREAVKAAFNDPADRVRVLIATDTAAEGLNLQETARTLLHFDVPWNPARLEQRNGRLDRHGQARDVTAYHFASREDADLAFLAHVVRKVETIREDLGSTGEVFDAAFHRRFILGEAVEPVREDFDAAVEAARGQAEVPRDAAVETGEEEIRALEALAREIDLDAETIRETLEAALGLESGGTRFEGPDGRSRLSLAHPIPAGWAQLIDDTLRLGGPGGRLSGLVFDPNWFLQSINGRRIYRTSRDTVLLHLGHPLLQRALACLARARYPGSLTSAEISRWTVRRGSIPDGSTAVLLLTVEELAVNELRESFHHWVRTIAFPVRNGRLGDPLPHRPAAEWGREARAGESRDIEEAREIWDEVAEDARSWIRTHATELTRQLRETLIEEGEAAVAREQERYQSRQGEISRLIEETTLGRIERELEENRRRREQLALFHGADRERAQLASDREREEEVARMRSHYAELREQLQKERERVIRHLLPRRYELRGEAQVFPVAVEVRLRCKGVKGRD